MNSTPGGTDGPGGQDPPSAPWNFHRLICAARGIGMAERLVLFAMLRWIDADGRAWPAVQTIAGAAGLSREGAQKALRALKRRKVILDESDSRGGVDATGRGRPTRRRIDWRALARLAPIDSEKGEPSTPLASEKGERRDPQGRTARPRRANGATLKGEPGSPDSPETHQGTDQQPTSAPDARAAGAGVLDLLIGKGINPKRARSLAENPRLTAEIVERIARAAGVDAGPPVLCEWLADDAAIDHAEREIERDRAEREARDRAEAEALAMTAAIEADRTNRPLIEAWAVNPGREYLDNLHRRADAAAGGRWRGTDPLGRGDDSRALRAAMVRIDTDPARGYLGTLSDEHLSAALATLGGSADDLAAIRETIRSGAMTANAVLKLAHAAKSLAPAGAGPHDAA